MVDLGGIVGLVPARSGSQRLKDKNILPLAGHPLMAYTIAASNMYLPNTYVTSDSEEYLAIAEKYGAKPILRPKEISDGPTLSYVQHALSVIPFKPQIIVLLRPTSPFRGVDAVKKALSMFLNSRADSLRAVSPITEHPYKMWHRAGRYIEPSFSPANNYYDYPNQVLENTYKAVHYIQNGSMEIFWVDNIETYGNTTGKRVIAYYSVGYEQEDINTREDYERCVRIAEMHEGILPDLDVYVKSLEGWEGRCKRQNDL